MEKEVRSAEALAALVEEMGFLPFFRNEIEGFSVEEHTPRELWWDGETWGPWEWKGPVIQSAHCAYGKFYRGKAVYISEEWFPDFANFRRDGSDFDSRMDEGIARGRVCFTEERKKNFDGALTHLQMQCYVTTENFEYERDRHGKEYGWGLARYTTPEHFFIDFAARAYAREPKESYARMEAYLSRRWPHASLSQIGRFLREK